MHQLLFSKKQIKTCFYRKQDASVTATGTRGLAEYGALDWMALPLGALFHFLHKQVTHLQIQSWSLHWQPESHRKTNQRMGSVSQTARLKKEIPHNLQLVCDEPYSFLFFFLQTKQPTNLEEQGARGHYSFLPSLTA